jgi:hypothetical protein
MLESGSLTMARKHLGRVVAPDKETTIDRAMEEFRIEPARPSV